MFKHFNVTMVAILQMLNLIDISVNIVKSKDYKNRY